MENFGQKLKWLIVFILAYLFGWLLIVRVFACYGTCHGFLAFMNRFGVGILSVVFVIILAVWIGKNFKDTRPE